MNHGTVTNNGREPSAREVFRHVNIRIMAVVSRMTQEAIRGISDGNPTIEIAMVEPSNAHQASEHDPKKRRADVLSDFAV